MRSILLLDKPKLLNIKFKKFKKLKKWNKINKLKLTNFFISYHCDVDSLLERIMILESISGESFKISRFRFFNDNKKHFNLGALIFFKLQIFKKKVFPCLSYFFIYQFFLYYEFFLKAKISNKNEFLNYFSPKMKISKGRFFTNFFFFECWADLTDFFIYPTFSQDIEDFDTSESYNLSYAGCINLDFVLFYKFKEVFLKALNVVKKNMLKFLIFLYKKYFFRFSFKKIVNRRIKRKIIKRKGKRKKRFTRFKSFKLKLFFSKKYLLFKKKC